MVYSSIVEKLFLKSVDVDFNRKAPLYWIFVSFVKDLRVLKMEQVNAEFLSPPPPFPSHPFSACYTGYESQYARAWPANGQGGIKRLQEAHRFLRERDVLPAHTPHFKKCNNRLLVFARQLKQKAKKEYLGHFNNLWWNFVQKLQFLFLPESFGKQEHAGMCN